MGKTENLSAFIWAFSERYYRQFLWHIRSFTCVYESRPKLEGQQYKSMISVNHFPRSILISTAVQISSSTEFSLLPLFFLTFPSLSLSIFFSLISLPFLPYCCHANSPPAVILTGSILIQRESEFGWDLCVVRCSHSDDPHVDSDLCPSHCHRYNEWRSTIALVPLSVVTSLPYISARC